jgi:hypothetical protein
MKKKKIHMTYDLRMMEEWNAVMNCDLGCHMSLCVSEHTYVGICK